jgi:N-acetylmuramoyl-L-alanine amidase CwlA
MKINKNITNTNRTVRNGRKIEYIVIHYVGAVSTAKNNTIYFKDAYRGASAHYFVDDSSIWQCVEEKDRA